MEKKLLIYGFENDPERCNKICRIADKYNIKVENIMSEDIENKVGYLMGIYGYEKVAEKSDNKIDIQFMLFSDFDREILAKFLTDLRNEGITVPYKSVITETTKDWRFSYLLDHIQEEHRVMTKFNELGKYVKKAMEILQEEKNEELEFAVKSAMELTQRTDISEKDVDEKFELFKGLREFERLLK